MTGKTILHRIAAVATALLAAATAIYALDLPTRTVNGRQCYYYKVKAKETVYGLSKRFGLSREEIVEHNPSAADGVKKGMILYFPVDDFAERGAEDATETEEAAPTASADADAMPAPVAAEPELPANGGVVAAESPRKSHTVVLLLPFMLDEEGESRSTRLITDFYKGFLIAADTLSKRGEEVRIVAIDSRGSAEYAGGLMATNKDLREASVIVAPDHEGCLETVASEAAARGSYVINLFNTRDSLYLSNPYLLQATIPADEMYAKAVDGLFGDFGDAMPVVLRNRSGRNEKEPFTAHLLSRCEATGREYREIEYDGSLTRASLDTLDSILRERPGQKMVIVPSSGSLAEFNKFSHMVRSFRDDNAGLVDVFGYPDWSAFRGEALDMLHALEATIYSRFYDDFMSFDARTIDGEFRRWYGSGMVESVPSQGLLGYDAGCYIIKNLRLNDGAFNPASPSEYKGIQSTFAFKRHGHGGYANNALYIIHYLPEGKMSAKTL